MAGAKPKAVAIVSACAVVVALVAAFLFHAHHGAEAAGGDRCSRDARPADGRARADIGGLSLLVPKGWYDVPVCFATAAMVQPAGYVTSQTPVAQCRPVHQGQVGCGPPVGDLASDDVLLVASTLPRSADPGFRAMETIAGLPAQEHFEKPGYHGQRFADVSVLVDSDTLVRLTAYAGSDARSRSDQLRAMIEGATTTNAQAVPGQNDPDNRLTFTDPRGRRISIVPTNLRCGLATYGRHHRQTVQLELQRSVSGRYLDILRVEALPVPRPTTYRLPLSAGSDQEGSENAFLSFSRTDFAHHHQRNVAGVSTDENAFPHEPRTGSLEVLAASCKPVRLHLVIHGKLLSNSSDGPPLVVTGGVDLTGY